MNKKPHSDFVNVIFYVLGTLFKKFSKIFDRMLFDGRGSIFVSLFLAIFICVAIDYDTISFRLLNDTTSTVTVSDVAVNVLYDSDKYEISGVPDTVDMTLTGQTADIQVYRQQGIMQVNADLRKYGEGMAIVDLSVEGLPSSLSAKVNPASITVELEEKVTKRFSVSSELMVGNGQKVSDFMPPELKTTTVEVKGSRAKLDSIRVVKALIDTTGQVSNFTTNATIVAYDATGNALNVEMNPSTIEAYVQIATEDNTTENTKGE